MISLMAGCHGVQKSSPVAQIPYNRMDNRQADKGGYWKESITINREGGNHDRSHSTQTQNPAMDNCPQPLTGGTTIVPTPMISSGPSITPPSGK